MNPKEILTKESLTRSYRIVVDHEQGRIEVINQNDFTNTEWMSRKTVCLHTPLISSSGGMEYVLDVINPLFNR